MHWIKSSGYPHYEYRLLQQGEPVLKMFFDFTQSNFKATCEAAGQVFEIDREGLWKDKIVLREDQILTGRVTTQSWHSAVGKATVNNQETTYKFTTDPLALHFYDGEALLLTCALAPENSAIAVEIIATDNLENHPLKTYLLALSWYLFLPVAADNTSEFSA